MRVLGYDIQIEPLPEKEGGGYVAIVPDLPGCMSQGATPEEATHRVFNAIVGRTAIRLRKPKG